jgi:amidase
MRFLSISDQLKAYRHKNISVEEAILERLSHIDRYNPTLNAIVHSTKDAALAKARQLDANREAQQDLPLFGIPVTIKECFAMQNSPTTINYPLMRNHKTDFDSILVKRLQSAGAIILGKTNVPMLLADCQTFGPLYATCNNPFDVKRTPGGSTGGGASALAAEFTNLEIGSDIGGSIRNPANFCGVFGIKPTNNGHAQDGHFPPLPGKGKGYTALNSTGPLARSMADLRTAYSVCYTPRTDYQQYLQLEKQTRQLPNLEGYKIAWYNELLGLKCSNTTQQGLARIIKTLEVAGAKVEEIKIDEKLTDRVLKTWVKLFGFSVGQDFPWAIRKLVYLQFVKDLKRTSRINAKRELKTGLGLDFRDFSEALHEQQECSAEFSKVFDRYDFILSPTNIGPAFEHNHRHKDILFEGERYAYLEYCFMFVMFYNLLGNPVLTMPSGLSADGLPIGISVAARHQCEEALLHFGELIETAGHRFAPPDLKF